jgi:heme exporter protein A
VLPPRRPLAVPRPRPAAGARRGAASHRPERRGQDLADAHAGGPAAPLPSLQPRDATKAGTIAWEGTIALADERPALDPALPLGKALDFWRSIDGARDLPLARLGLDGLLDVPVRYLSTGQKKRAALARLIGQNAQNWLLDEPLNGLDVAGVALIEELVAQHCAQGGSAIVTSHQPIRLPGDKRLDIADYAL